MLLQREGEIQGNTCQGSGLKKEDFSNFKGDFLNALDLCLGAFIYVVILIIMLYYRVHAFSFI